MRKIGVGIMAILIASLISGCSSQSADLKKETKALQTTVEQNQDEIQYLKERISQLEQENKQIILENQRLSNNSHTIFGEHFVTVLKEILGEEETIKLAQSKIKYSLRVNDVHLKDKVTSVKKGEVVVSLSEGYVSLNDKEIIIPQQFFDMGFINYNGGEEYHKHIEVTSDEEFFTNPGAGTVVWAQGYIFENAKAGSIIKVKITDELKKRLGVEHNEFEIRVTN